MISPELVARLCCPDCRGTLHAAAGQLTCQDCGRAFDASRGYADLQPADVFAERTKYLDEALHADARHESAAPPVLGSKIRLDMLRRFLTPSPGDRIVDLGCGSGRTLIWNADTGASMTGVDVAPFFSRDAIARCDLVRAELRRLPLRSESFTKAWSLDVLEHLPPPALREMLAEANRVLAPGGSLFVYTHVRRNSWIAGGVRLVNRLARGLERIGLIDLSQERLRKSDHVNPLTDHDELARVAGDAGFRIERVTYYTPIAGAFVENVLVRMAERWMTRRAASGGGSAADALRVARTTAQARVAQRGWTYRALLLLTAFMKVDVALFGRVRSGPFFALLRKTTRHAGPEGPAYVRNAAVRRPEGR